VLSIGTKITEACIGVALGGLSPPKAAD